MRPIEQITRETFEKFGDRKTKGRIDFVIDLDANRIFPVPKRVEHSEFIPSIPGFVNSRATRYVPIQFRLEDGEVKGIITGASSYEAKYEIFHTMGELASARKSAWELLARSNLKINLKRDVVKKDYAVF